MNNNYNLLVILGPTASGKTSFASQFAFKTGGEIISADSRQVYRRMDLGTGKDYSDYIINGAEIPFHLIDIREPGYKYNVYEYQNDFFKAYKEIGERGNLPIMCGGTGLYIEAVLNRFRIIHVPADLELREKLSKKSLPELETILMGFRKTHNKTDTDTIKRAIRAIEIEAYYASHPEIKVDLPEITPLIMGIDIDREKRRERITGRLQQRLDNGMVDEVKKLLNEGVSSADLIYYGLEYKYITQYLIGVLDYNEMREQLNIAIHQFAKRQMTWFRKMERNGFKIHWIKPCGDFENEIKFVEELYKKGNP